MIGLATTYDVVCGVNFDDIEILPTLISEDLESFLGEEHDGFIQKMLRAEDRYVFL